MAKLFIIEGRLAYPQIHGAALTNNMMIFGGGAFGK